MKELRRVVKFCLPLILLALILFAPAAGSAGNTKQVLEYYQQWQETLHSNHSLANPMNQGAIDDPGGHDAGCMKCHTESGFVQWSEHGFVIPGHDGESYADKPDKPGTALSITCIACHDPNMKASGDDPMLRIVGKTPEITGGFPVEGAGTGASCFICHTSNRGLYVEQNRARMNQRAPHEGSQADLMMGQNFFFVKVEKSPHMEMDNTCVDCHGGGGETTDHTFSASFKNCQECHEDIDGEKLEHTLVKQIDDFKATYENAVKKFIEAGLKAGNFKLLNMTEDEVQDKEFTSFKGGKVSAVKSGYFHGGQAFKITIDGKEWFTFLHKIVSDGKNLIDTAQGQIIAKSGWNLYMILHDGSKGAHNTNLVTEVMKVSSGKLAGLNFSMLKALPPAPGGGKKGKKGKK